MVAGIMKRAENMRAESPLATNALVWSTSPRPESSPPCRCGQASGPSGSAMDLTSALSHCGFRSATAPNANPSLAVANDRFDSFERLLTAPGLQQIERD